MNRKRKRRRTSRTRKPVSLLRLLKSDELPAGQSLKNRGLGRASLKDLYTPSEPDNENQFPVPWNCMSPEERIKTKSTLDQLPKAMENRIIRAGAESVPREVLFLGPNHVVEEKPANHAPLPNRVPSAPYDLLTDDQKGVLMGMSAHTSLRRFLRRAQQDWWTDATMNKLKQSMGDSVGLVLHLFRRISEDCFVVSFRIDSAQRFYVGMAFRPDGGGGDDRDDRVNLFGRKSPYSVYFFTCKCR